jgi:ribonuclease HI
MANNTPPSDTLQGIVLWSDGSSAPSNPGYGGWGLHGYTYSVAPAKKGNGLSGQVLTDQGYLDKTSAKTQNSTEVKPVNYVDGFGSFAMPVTNNLAEIAGVANGLLYAANHDVKRVTLLTDSMYVVEGVGRVANWAKNNWIKYDGNPVANKDMWLTLSANLLALKDKGVDVQIKWVKGHSVHLGNNLADKHANIGNRYSRRGELRTEFNTTAADGYWTAKIERHPFISQRRIYFVSRQDACIPGEYFLGEHGKDDELLGKRTADGAHSYVRLSTPEPVVEMLRQAQIKAARGEDAIVMGRLDKLFETSTHNDLMRFGDVCLYRAHRNKMDLHFIEKKTTPDGKVIDEPVTKELNPPRLAMRAIESVNFLKSLLLTWLGEGQTTVTQTDVTDTFYATDAKGKCTLRSEFIVGFSTLSAQVNYVRVPQTTPLVEQQQIDLFLGVDLPERNALKRMEALSPLVHVLTWMESEHAFRHATVIQAGTDIGVWAGMFSNLRVIPSGPTASATALTTPLTPVTP